MLCLENVKTAEVTRVMTRVTLRSVFETNKSPFCIELMVVYVFQHKSDVFRLIDVINGEIFYIQTKFINIDITSRDTRLPHIRFLSCARL